MVTYHTESIKNGKNEQTLMQYISSSDQNQRFHRYQNRPSWHLPAQS